MNSNKAAICGKVGMLAVMCVLLAGVAAAQERQGKETCLSQDKSIPPDLRLQSCTAAIQSGKEEPHTLSSLLVYRAMSLIQRKEIDRATADIEQAIHVDPNSALAITARGFLLWTKGDLDRALADFNEALRLDPNLTDAHLDRAVVYMQRRDFDHAIADLNEILRTDPANAAAIYNRGSAYLSEGNLDQGFADYNEAIRLEPSAARFKSRGNAYSKKATLTAR